MTTAEDKLIRAIELANSGGVSEEDFEVVMNALVAFAKETKELAADDLVRIKEYVKTALDEVKFEQKDGIKQVKEASKVALKETQDAVVERLATIHDGIDGAPGRDGKDTDPLVVAKIVLKEMPTTGNEIIDEINLDNTEKKIKHERIEGWEELERKVFARQNIVMGGTSGRDIFKDIDISSQLDGVTKTFNIQAVYNIISVHVSSFPHALRKTIDFTYTDTSITFTDEIDAATTLDTGPTVVLTVVQA